MTLLARLAAAVIVCVSATGVAAQDAVWDPGEIANLANKSAQSALALSQLVEALEALKVVAISLGRQGPVAVSVGASSADVAGLAGLSSSGQNGFVSGQMMPSAGSGSLLDTATMRSAVNGFATRAGEDGVALAFHEVEDLSQAKTAANGLVAQAKSAADLRSDIGANTAVTLATLAELTKLAAMLACIVEERSVAAMPSTLPQSPGGQ
jgi:hypothetical protein